MLVTEGLCGDQAVVRYAPAATRASPTFVFTTDELSLGARGPGPLARLACG